MGRHTLSYTAHARRGKNEGVDARHKRNVLTRSYSRYRCPCAAGEHGKQRVYAHRRHNIRTYPLIWYDFITITAGRRPPAASGGRPTSPRSLTTYITKFIIRLLVYMVQTPSSGVLAKQERCINGLLKNTFCASIIILEPNRFDTQVPTKPDTTFPAASHRAIYANSVRPRVSR